MVSKVIVRTQDRPSRVKNVVIGIGIFIVYLLMLHYGVEAFYPSPQYDKFCGPNSYDRGPYPISKPVDLGTVACTFNRSLQQQVDQCYTSGGNPIYEYNDTGCQIAIQECNMCNKEYTEAQKAHSRVVFIIALIIGLITLVIGYILSVEPIGSALMASGVGAIFYGSTRNWANLSDIWRFLLLVIALALLIWIALRINARRKE